MELLSTSYNFTQGMYCISYSSCAYKIHLFFFFFFFVIQLYKVPQVLFWLFIGEFYLVRFYALLYMQCGLAMIDFFYLLFLDDHCQVTLIYFKSKS